MYKVFVGNLNFKTTEDQLRAIFASHFAIEDVVIARDAAGKSQGYGFVMTKEVDKGREALRRIGKVEIDQRLIYFKESTGKKKKKGIKPQGAGPGGASGGGGGHRPQRPHYRSPRRGGPFTGSPRRFSASGGGGPAGAGPNFHRPSPPPRFNKPADPASTGGPSTPPAGPGPTPTTGPGGYSGYNSGAVNPFHPPPPGQRVQPKPQQPKPPIDDDSIGNR